MQIDLHVPSSFTSSKTLHGAYSVTLHVHYLDLDLYRCALAGAAIDLETDVHTCTVPYMYMYIVDL